VQHVQQHLLLANTMYRSLQENLETLLAALARLMGVMYQIFEHTRLRATQVVGQCQSHTHL
jgi:hypothetical protein